MPLTWSDASDQALAGFVAGSSSTIILHPLDLIKVKLQVQEGRIESLSRTRAAVMVSRDILSSQGWKGFYRGLSPNFAGSTLSWTMYFFFYAQTKEWFGEGNNTKLSPVEHLSASAIAGWLTSLIANPLFVVKTRMFTQKATDDRRYSGLTGT
jgi:solute carrier family 25 folate transporter 32